MIIEAMIHTKTAPALRRDKATHLGTCQVCGSLQKLPAGVLSKHGYTTRWGFFSGVCSGSGYKPFELAFDRIQLSIDQVKAQIADIERQIAEMNAEPIGDVAPWEAYRSKPSMYQHTGYYESTITLSTDERGSLLMTHAGDDTRKKTELALTHSLYGSIADVVIELRASKQRRMQKQIDKRNEFVTWQQHRIATWKLGTLTPVKTETKGRN